MMHGVSLSVRETNLAAAVKSIAVKLVPSGALMMNSNGRVAVAVRFNMAMLVLRRFEGSLPLPTDPVAATRVGIDKAAALCGSDLPCRGRERVTFTVREVLPIGNMETRRRSLACAQVLSDWRRVTGA
jgi:hypothetical protein